MKEFKLLLAALCFGILPFAALGCGDDETACDEGFESDGDGGCVEVGAAEGTEGGEETDAGTPECTPACEGKCGGDDGCDGTCTAESTGALKCSAVQTCVASNDKCEVSCAGGCTNQKCPGTYDFCAAAIGACKPVPCTQDSDCIGLDKCDSPGSAARTFVCDSTKQCVDSKKAK